MRNIIITISLCFISVLISAQVVEKNMTLSAGDYAGLEVEIKADAKDAEKIWKEYIKPYGKPDWDRRNKEHVLFNKRISSISSEPVTIVTKFDQGRGSFWIKLGDNFLNSENDVETFRKAAEFLQEYAYEVERHMVREEIKNQEKDLERLEKDLEKLVKKNENLHKDIQKAKEEIAKKEREIAQNLEEQKEKKGSIEGQKEVIKKTTIKLTQVGKGS